MTKSEGDRFIAAIYEDGITDAASASDDFHTRIGRETRRRSCSSPERVAANKYQEVPGGMAPMVMVMVAGRWHELAASIAAASNTDTMATWSDFIRYTFRTDSRLCHPGRINASPRERLPRSMRPRGVPPLRPLCVGAPTSPGAGGALAAACDPTSAGPRKPSRLSSAHGLR